MENLLGQFDIRMYVYEKDYTYVLFFFFLFFSRKKKMMMMKKEEDEIGKGKKKVEIIKVPDF